MKTLTNRELATAQAMIDYLTPGEYTLKDIYQSRWSSISSPTQFGKAFKAAVQTGALHRIHLKTLKSNNHNVYAIDN